MKRRCPKCSAAWEIKGPIGFREECPECAAFVHTCLNCRNYDPVRRDCRIPTTEPVHDCEGANFCEDYEFGTPASGTAASRIRPAAHSPPADGKISAEEARRRFENMFRDPES